MLERNGPIEIFNSDQCSQYTSKEHTQLLKDHSITISMNEKGRNIDKSPSNASSSLKYEEVYIKKYENVKELKAGIRDFITFYNSQMFHSSLGYRKPMNVYLGHQALIQNISG